MTQSPHQRLADFVRRFGERRVLVVGDLVADRFVYGEISRVSREAPVLILRHERTETVPGGAANCAANLATLGARTALVGIVGEDEAGRVLLTQLGAAGVDCSRVILSNGFTTTTKERILAGQAHSTRQQVIRVDYESGPPADTERGSLSEPSDQSTTLTPTGARTALHTPTTRAIVAKWPSIIRSPRTEPAMA